MRLVGYLLSGVVALAVVFALGWLALGNDLAQLQFFGPKYANAHRTIYEQSHSYRQGMVQNMHSLQQQYVLADADHRGGLASIVELRVGDVADPDSLPSDVRAFVSCVNRSRAANDFTDSCAPN